ncbi:TPA: non-heme iron oxygenase ferredoxin subunit [Kluyvera ascorbata]|uniref:Non-heme iron oxygenase ferredoxin subunit n=1 Tax=Kluyvera genomosp. 3 TaxID=2774055 RepID=A0A6G9RMB2_9ENTR|nr:MULTISPECIES: non-heme iron oxygenase ferredoxin subunit [Kluyvera]HCR3980983.1 non-heme iron oxygenase ferredoxin subunit [Kluyvera ascorbata]MDA8488717.1 non-heme iron oxygenase ferredoxin subunit [Kluyvera sp. Awk 3]QIR27425.1 non-heme iron oxygenase ferredoxin subunit [Kluyvera genomosp. 3]UAK19087.1 non-heme iron oxygenase ferredoxin subunit [Kluyvera sp. CRP]HDT6544832.1 non-heme iron oxygenase ferredoxin subunit [Kluyvera ascorbata]
MSDSWILAASLAELPEDDVIGVEVNGRDIALYRTDEGIFASDNRCSHGNARLSDGFLEDGEIECPLHQGRFCIKTGKAMCSPLTEGVTIYPVQVEEEKVYLKFS